ncbi:MAG: 3-oxoacyl-(acyl-carrier-protein) synthase [Granulosicoccus sp.]|jgi:3-oxoacyl-(acyl-carrier-protein) synthase
MARALITGMGVVSAIGNNVAENHKNLRAGRTGLKKPQFLQSKYAELFSFGEVGLSNAQLFEELQLDDPKGITRTELLSLKAFREAVAQAGLSPSDLSSVDTAFISGTTVGGMAETKHLHEDANSNVQPSEFVNSYRSGAHTLRIAKIHGMSGYTDTINTACSSAANAILLGARMIRTGRVKRAIVGGVDSLAKYTVNGFNSLQIFSDELMQPFDQNRKGLNLGEGAGYLVLEAEDIIGDRPILGEVSGYGNANDAHHPSAMSPDAVGVRGAITRALKSASLDASKIDTVNAHGTGTPNNDQTELFGLTKIFETVPPFVSTKSYTGHTLAASGGIEAVYSLLSILNGEVYPSLNFNTPMEGFTDAPNTELLENQQIDHVLSNSFGFGGNCTSLILSKA